MKYLSKYLNGWLTWRKRLSDVFILKNFFCLIGFLSLLACSSDDALWAPVTDIAPPVLKTPHLPHLPSPTLRAASPARREVKKATTPPSSSREMKTAVLQHKFPSPLAGEVGLKGRKGAVLLNTPHPPLLPSPALRAPSPTRGEVNIKTWLWPSQGKIASRFVANSKSLSANKGIDIEGVLGQDVKSTAGGKVVYSGSGVRGYGNLIIIKHDKNYLSAYAYNQKLLVKEGDSVTAGQAIAEMGKAETGRVLLHFEIRYNGQPVDPMVYLNRQGKS